MMLSECLQVGGTCTLSAKDKRDVLSCPRFSVSSPAFRPLVIISCQCAPFITISHPSNPILKLAQITFRIKCMGCGIT